MKAKLKKDTLEIGGSILVIGMCLLLLNWVAKESNKNSKKLKDEI